MKESILQKKWIRWVSSGIVLVIMIAIFISSDMKGEQSEGLSYPVGNKVITSGALNGVKSLVEETGEDFSHFVQVLVRKSAHFLAFLLLGGALFVCYESWLGEGKLNWIWSIMVGVVYAASDEWHQTTVPGRSGRMTDVLIDAAGIVVGVLAAMGIVWLIKKRIKKRMIE